MLLVGNSKKGPSAFGSLSKQCQCRQGVEGVFDLSHLVGGPTHVIQTCSAPPRPDTNNPSRPRSTLRISAFRPPAVASSSPEFHSRVITPLCHGTAIAASKLERPRNPRPKFKKTPDGKKKTSESTHHLVRPFRTLCCARIVVVSSPNPPLP